MKKNLPVTLSYWRVQRPTRLVLAALVLSACAFGARAESHRAEAHRGASQNQASEQQQTARRTITGVVTDAAGKPLSGAAVMVSGAQGVGTNTDASGHFSLTVARGARLNVSSMGFKTQTVAVGDQQTLNIKLTQDVITTETAVVTGMFSKPRESYTGAATMLNATQLQEAGGGNLVQAIGNLDPTFYVAENILDGSNPNALPIVTMRGGTALPVNVTNMADATAQMNENNLPLLILNDFEVPFSRIVDIDQNMVESITLLKDASATSIYGTRGANGVVVVTTKRPKPGTLQLTYRGRLDIEAPDLSSYNLLDASEKLMYEQLAGMYSVGSWSSYKELSDRLTSRRIEVLRGVNTDWLHYPVRAGISHSHTLQIEGGEEAFRYGMNAGLNEKAGVMKGSGREAFNGSMYFQYSTKKLVFRNELEITSTIEKNSPYGKFWQYVEMNPYFKPYSDDGKLLKNVDDTPYANIFKDNPRVVVANPLWNANQPNKNTTNTLGVRNSFAADWTIMPGLKLQGLLGVNFNRGRSDEFRSADMTDFDHPYYTGDKVKLKGSYKLGQSQMSNIDAQIKLYYSKTFVDKHLLTLNLAGTIRQTKSENFSNTGYAISDPDNAFYGATHYYRDDAHPFGVDANKRSVGMIFSANYMFDSRYFVDLSGNFQGSSVFGSNQLWAPIWSLGVGWNIHKESWFNSANVDYARLRASYGLTASENFVPGLSQVMFKDLDQTYDIWGGSSMQGIGNPDLKWSPTYSWNVGTEWSLWQNRLTLTADVYRRLTKDLIANVGLPPASGFYNYAANIGEVENRGWEVKLTGIVLQNREKKFSWLVGGSAVHNDNKILKISDALKKMNEELAKRYSPEGGKPTQAEYKDMTSPAFLFKEGQSLNTIYVVQSLGIDPMTGREVLVDRDGKTYFGDQYKEVDQVPWGTTDPKVHGSLFTTLRYRGWRLSAYFNYSLGGKAYNQALANKVETVEPWLNVDRRALYDRWSEVGQIAKFKRIGELSATKPTSRFVMDNNYFSLSQLSLAWDVPEGWSKRVLGMSFLSLSAETSDMFHIATIKRERGTDYPFARKFSLSLTARF